MAEMEQEVSPGVENKRTIMLAVDASARAQEAVKWYIDCLHRPENRVVLVHSPEGPTVTTEEKQHHRMTEETIQKLLDKEKKEMETLQTKYDTVMADSEVPHEYKTVYGRAGEALVAAALELHADMVVMGTRGLGTLRRTILGSVSDYVVHHAHCPVIVCRH